MLQNIIKKNKTRLHDIRNKSVSEWISKKKTETSREQECNFENLTVY